MDSDFSARVEALEASTEALQHTLAGLTDEQVRGQSLLPGWTRGHVLTHLARNGDAMLNLATWARTGEETPMYASREKRDADIEEGAGRPAAALVADVKETHQQLITALRELPESAHAAPIRYARTETDASAIPVMRRKEVEIHHVDLDLDHTLAHLPEDFVEAMLDEVTDDYSARDDAPGFVLVSTDDERRWTVAPGGPEVVGSPPSLLGWLLGRTDGIGLHTDGALPTLGAWR